VLAAAPKDRATVTATARALAGAGWVVRERRVIPDRVESGLRTLAVAQRRSAARRYVG
jgi:hypothetical protein